MNATKNSDGQRRVIVTRIEQGGSRRVICTKLAPTGQRRTIKMGGRA